MLECYKGSERIPDDDNAENAIRQAFDEGAFDEELWDRLDTIDPGHRINVPIATMDLRRIREFDRRKSDQFYQCCYEPQPEDTDGAADFFGPRFPSLDRAIGYGFAVASHIHKGVLPISVNLYNAVGEEKLAEFVRHVRWIDRNKDGHIEVGMPPEKVAMPKLSCKFCNKPIPGDGHLHQGSWVGDCCWDERLRTTE